MVMGCRFVHERTPGSWGFLLRIHRVDAGHRIHHGDRRVAGPAEYHTDMGTEATGGSLMNTSVLIAIIGAVASVVGVIIAQRVTARNATKASETTERLEERKLDQAGWAAQYAGWKDDALKLREQRDRDQERYEQDRIKFEARLAEMDAKLTEIVRARAQEQAYLDSLLSWCRVVVVLLRQAGISFPPLPPGVTAPPPPLPSLPTSPPPPPNPA